MDKFTSRLNYAFAIGKIRALEKFLIKEEVFKEALGASLAEALRLFVESDLYSERLIHIKDSQELETILTQEVINLKNFIRNLLLDKELIGLLDISDFTSAKKILKKYKSDFLNDYLLYLIDMHNIKTFLRLYILKAPQEELKASLKEEGFLAKEFFIESYGSDLTFFLHKLEYVHKHAAIINYAIYLQDGIKKLLQANSFVVLERAINDFLIEVLKPAKYISFGPEPLLAYYFAKVNEINLMRMIILAKLNEVSADLVKERLNLVYA